MLPDFGPHLLVVAIVALVVVGPKDLPLLLRKLGQFTGRMRAMASEFRASFDEMARQSELDELRKEVEALRTGQNIVSGHLEPAFNDINQEISQGLTFSPASISHEMTPLAEPLAEPAPVTDTIVETPKPKRAPRKPAAPKTQTAAKSAAKPAAKTVSKPAAKRVRKTGAAS